MTGRLASAIRYLTTYLVLLRHFAVSRKWMFALMVLAVLGSAVLHPLPFLLIAGQKDLLATPEAVLTSQQALGGEVEFVLASRAGGFADDYGHGDLTLGRKAPEEIFPRIAAFLAARSTPA